MFIKFKDLNETAIIVENIKYIKKDCKISAEYEAYKLLYNQLNIQDKEEPNRLIYNIIVVFKDETELILKYKTKILRDFDYDDVIGLSV